MSQVAASPGNSGIADDSITLSSFHFDRLYCSTMIPRYFELEMVIFSSVACSEPLKYVERKLIIE